MPQCWGLHNKTLSTRQPPPPPSILHPPPYSPTPHPPNLAHPQGNVLTELSHRDCFFVEVVVEGFATSFSSPLDAHIGHGKQGAQQVIRKLNSIEHSGFHKGAVKSY